ncbi:MAG TPA: DUF2892 domain-containing protein [Candidatus Krumholzibacteria bacterium]|nr:DUF2892 domain-containing protein [Candidatus Krumholzibacteria bacterium]
MESNVNKNACGCAHISWPERMVRRLAGIFIIVSMLLAWKVSPWWLILTGFVGINLLQSSFTGFCPPEILFRRMEAKRKVRTAALNH